MTRLLLLLAGSSSSSECFRWSALSRKFLAQGPGEEEAFWTSFSVGVPGEEGEAKVLPLWSEGDCCEEDNALASSRVEGICGNSRSYKHGKMFSEGQEAGKANCIRALGWPNKLQASDDKNFLAQGKHAGLRRTVVKKSAQICGTITGLCELRIQNILPRVW